MCVARDGPSHDATRWANFVKAAGAHTFGRGGGRASSCLSLRSAGDVSGRQFANGDIALVADILKVIRFAGTSDVAGISPLEALKPRRTCAGRSLIWRAEGR